MSNNNLIREIDEAEKQMRFEAYKTALKKSKFILEINSGLGAEIKKNPNKIHIIQKTWFEKFILKLKALFTKF